MSDVHRLLLDTHIFLWWRGAPHRLTEPERQAIAEAEIVFVSVASAWEIAIKTALGRLELPMSVESGVRDSGFEKLAVTFAHAALVGELPHHHGDPFDRMLIAQAQVEKLTLVTHDKAIGRYEIDILAS